ncbi:uncharacterized protein LOC120850895 [Ixodes scapularis]|uniref:uncharacterized protein LOC120850895 n=1 Tax=Ixodes scapularis TaxID=6945 RepID=UPI001A9CB991|nr:uncharacterized protein LOC120850895 [Ixodes scapularis]
MYRDICNMLLVLFAVVPILLASQEEVSTTSPRECMRALSGGANIFCQLFGYEYFRVLDPETGELGCEDGTKKVELPESVWPRGTSMTSCSQNLKKTLEEFSSTMKRIKDSLEKRGCNIF